jgi:hypothetical protein
LYKAFGSPEREAEDVVLGATDCELVSGLEEAALAGTLSPESFASCIIVAWSRSNLAFIESAFRFAACACDVVNHGLLSMDTPLAGG